MVNFINNIINKIKKNKIEPIYDLNNLSNDKIRIYKQEDYLDIVEEEIIDFKSNKKVLRVKNIQEPLYTIIIPLKLL